MKYLIYVLIVEVILGVTFGLFSVWGWNGLVPDLILLIVIALGLVLESFDYVFLGLVGGFWLDVIYGLPIGSFTVPLLFCGSIANYLLRQKLFSDIKWYHFVGAIVIATIFLKLWIWGFTNILVALGWGVYAISGVQILRHLFPNILVNVLLAYPAYILVEMFAHSQLRWKKNKLTL